MSEHTKTYGKDCDYILVDEFQEQVIFNPKPAMFTGCRPKITNGSKLYIGGNIRAANLMVDQHFNWFQKLMWKWCFGVKVEDYSEE